MPYLIKPEMLEFLRLLKQNNRREWMDAHRFAYEQAKHNFIEFVEAFLYSTKHLHRQEHLRAEQCIFRLARDIRFAKEKKPYKTNFGAWIAPGGRKSPFAGFYLHIEPAASFVAAGLYAPSPLQQKAVHQEIYYEWQKLLSILHQKNFANCFTQLQEPMLKRLPKDFSDAPAMIHPLLRSKQWIVRKDCSDYEVLSPDFMNQLMVYATLAQPFIDFLNNALQEQE